MANPASPPDDPSHQSLAALEGTAPLSVRRIGPDADELSKMLRVVHHEVQRHHRVGPPHLAAVRSTAPVLKAGSGRAGGVRRRPQSPQLAQDVLHSTLLTVADRNKYWPPVRCVDGAHGDRNLVSSCPSIDAYES